jgi:hypothetical protein
LNPFYLIPAYSLLTIHSTCYYPTDLVKIVVQGSGQDKLPTKAFTIPRDLLGWHSSYFAAALDPESDFCIGGDEALTLTEHIEIFEAFCVLDVH